MIRRKFFKNVQGGFMTFIAIVFLGIFGIIMMSLTGFIFIQNNVQRAKENREVALQAAEAGLDYYRWFLAHFPDDIQDGTGAPGPYVHDYTDPEGGTIGQFSLAVNGNQKCGDTTAIDITSTGSSIEDPSLTRIVQGKYARPSIAEFAYVLDSNVWAGADRQIYGPYHSNGGIRMDGTNYSSVTSSIGDVPPGWLCTGSFGCAAGGEQKPGIFGAGSGSALWNFPVTNVNFAGITTDLVTMKARAVSDGVYIGPAAPLGQGYRVVLKNDRTFDLYRVNTISWVWGFHGNDMLWHKDYHIIASQTLLGTTPLPASCGLLFIEDDVWLEGVVKGKVTVASADTINVGAVTDIVLNNNITYTATDGTDGLTAIAENSVLIPLLSPDNMLLSGVFIAQKGYYGRNHYVTSGVKEVPSAYDSWVKQNSLTTNGTIVSSGRVGEKWSCGGVYCSGYNTRTNSYDRFLASDPPPLTPFSSAQYEFTEWREEK